MRITLSNLEARILAKTRAAAVSAHKTSHAVGGTDSVFPADPGADRYLMWDDS
jgi:hypothetical protein